MCSGWLHVHLLLKMDAYMYYKYTFNTQHSHFVSPCTLQIVVDKTNQPWVVYDAGPRHVHSPLVCLPPVCGTADVFFRQLLELSQAGYRVISVSFALMK